MKKFFSIPGLCVALLVVTINARSQYSQYLDDALRYSTPGLGVSARSLGMGTAYTGVANDFSAVFSNPAGLGQMRLSEVTLGMSNVSYGNTSTFFNNSQSLTNSATSLNNLGLVYSLPVQQGSLVFAVGFGRQADYTTGLSFQGFNPKSSIIPTLFRADTAYDLAYNLGLERANGSTPYGDSLTQSGKVLEGGGLNNITLSGAIEASKNLYLGVTLNFISGSYSYTRNYYEDDLINKYSQNPFDLSSLSLLETVDHDISGFSMKLGVLYKFGTNSRFGFAIKTPSWITVKETYSRSGRSDFDNGEFATYATDVGSQYEYDLTTPYVFSAGFSHTLGDLMLVGDVEYTDWTQMQFSHATSDVENLNIDIKSDFRPTVNLRGGGEYEFGGTGFRVRAGFAYLPSPYSGGVSSYAQKYITGGIGFIVDNAFAIDLGYGHGYWKTSHWNYDATSTTDEDIKTDNVIGTISYRF